MVYTVCEFYRNTLEHIQGNSYWVRVWLINTQKFSVIIQVLYNYEQFQTTQPVLYVILRRSAVIITTHDFKLQNFVVRLCLKSRYAYFLFSALQITEYLTAWNCFLRKSKHTTLACVALPNFDKCM